jgi:hypothetical protein
MGLATTENGMLTAGRVAPAPGDAVTVQVTVWPDTPQLQNDPVEPGVPNVRFLSSVSATTKLPESALDPELLTVSVITPLEPEATAPPTAPPLGVWVAVSVIAAAAEIRMRSLVVAVAVAPKPLKLAVGMLVTFAPPALAEAVNGIEIDASDTPAASGLAAARVAVQVTN